MRFGTRGSEVQILSPRPFHTYKSMVEAADRGIPRDRRPPGNRVAAVAALGNRMGDAGDGDRAMRDMDRTLHRVIGIMSLEYP
jgi:hypothetical protein